MQEQKRILHITKSTYNKQINYEKGFMLAAVAFSLGWPATMVAKSTINGSAQSAVTGTTAISETNAVPATYQNLPDLTYAAEKAINSVVYIKVTVEGSSRTVQYSNPFEDFFGDFFGRGNGGDSQQRTYKEPDRKGAGSGVILTSDGYIVTNNHVVEGATEMIVKLNDNREFKARIIGTDKNSDLALIKIEAKDLQPITIGNSDNLRLGEWVLAIGNPFSLTSTVTAGIVSAKARTTGGNAVESSIQTDAAINPGNSGGALVNARGELVGINNMIYSQTGSYSGYGFAIPVSIMNKVVADLRKFGTVQRALMGISGQDVINYIDAQKEKGKEVELGTTEGVYVGEVSSDGAAHAAGIKEGDVITAVDGKKVTKFGELNEILANHRPGDKISVTYLRNKRNTTTSLTLRNQQGTTTAVENIDDEQLGIALRKLTASEKEELALSHGLMVTAVRDGKMKEAGITKGVILMRVNDKDLNSTDDFYDAVKRANMSTDRVLWIRAKTQTGYNKSFTVELSNPKKK